MASPCGTGLVCAGHQAQEKALPGDLSHRTFQARLLMSWPQAEFDNDRWVLIYLRKLVSFRDRDPKRLLRFPSWLHNSFLKPPSATPLLQNPIRRECRQPYAHKQAGKITHSRLRSTWLKHRNCRSMSMLATFHAQKRETQSPEVEVQGRQQRQSAGNETDKDHVSHPRTSLQYSPP